MSAFKYQWNQTIDVGTAGLLSKQWTSIRHILSLLVTANACVHVTAYVAVRRSLSTTYTAVVLGLLLRQYVSYQFGVWAETSSISTNSWGPELFKTLQETSYILLSVKIIFSFMIHLMPTWYCESFWTDHPYDNIINIKFINTLPYAWKYHRIDSTEI